MPLLCKKNLSPLQRRSLAGFAGVIACTAGLTMMVREAFEHVHLSLPGIWGLAIIAATPMGVMVFIVGRYLSQETDEFVRMLVVKAMLWGFGVTMVTDTIFSYLAEYAGNGRSNGMLQMLNIDVFFVSAAIALRLMARGYASDDGRVATENGRAE
jgi:hypothetical protein